MAEYIMRDDLLNYIGSNPIWNGDPSQYETHCAVCLVLSALRNYVEAFESADVEEVRHGKWEKQQNSKEKCSECGCGVVFQIVYGRWEYENYCPHCGAKMDKG